MYPCRPPAFGPTRRGGWMTHLGARPMDFLVHWVRSVMAAACTVTACGCPPGPDDPRANRCGALAAECVSYDGGSVSCGLNVEASVECLLSCGGCCEGSQCVQVGEMSDALCGGPGSVCHRCFSYERCVMGHCAAGGDYCGMVGVFLFSGGWRCANYTDLDPYRVSDQVGACFGLFGYTGNVGQVSFGIWAPGVEIRVFVGREEQFDYGVQHDMSEFANQPDGGIWNMLRVRFQQSARAWPLYFQPTLSSTGSVRLSRTGTRLMFEISGDLEEEGGELRPLTLRVSGWGTLRELNVSDAPCCSARDGG